MESPSLEVFKRCLNVALGDVVLGLQRQCRMDSLPGSSERSLQGCSVCDSVTLRFHAGGAVTSQRAGGRRCRACAGARAAASCAVPGAAPRRHGGSVPDGDQAGDAERAAGYPVVRGRCRPPPLGPWWGSRGARRVWLSASLAFIGGTGLCAGASPCLFGSAQPGLPCK